jgi:hypothetical protein
VVTRRLAALLVLVPLALPGFAAAHIRLAGEFVMKGRVTAAHAVPGEHVGEHVTRSWEFVAPCLAGQCRTERLVRSRATGGDKTVLHRRTGVFSHWTGKGSFFAPLKCGLRIYRLGERVFFKITVRITGAAVVDGTLVAISVKASYESYRRTNRTRCVGALGHDAAVYTGKLVMAAPVPPAPTPAPG